MNDDKEENRIVNGSRIMLLQSTKQSLHASWCHGFDKTTT